MNNKKAKALRKEAITRYHKGEPRPCVQERGELITEICDSLNKSRQWLYKWLRREDEVTTDSSISSP
jgi:uncharacterized membrane protein YcaP (DUF421 family)